MEASSKDPDLAKKTAPVVDWFQKIEKTLRSYWIYAAGHPTIKQFEETLHSTAQQYLSEHGELTVAVKPYEFLFLDTPVYHNEDKQENFSFGLHKDGVRQITFQDGLAFEELTQFLEILRTDFDSYEYCDDDRVTLLWKNNFEHIQYVIVESFMETGAHTEEAEELLQKTIDDLFKDRSFDSLASLQSGAVPATRRKLRRKDVQEIMNIPDINLEAKNLLEQEVENSRDELLLENDSMVQKILLIMFRMLLTESDKKEFHTLSRVVRRLTESLLRTGHFMMAAKIYNKLRELGDVTRNPSKENAAWMSEFYTSLNEKDVVNQAEAHLANPTLDDFSDVVALVDTFDANAAPVVFEWAVTITNPKFREVIVEPLARLGEVNPKLFISKLRSADADLAILILQVLFAIGSDTAAPYIKRAFSHPDAKVRLRVLQLATKDEEHAKGLFVAGLNDADKSVRLNSLTHILHLEDRKLAKNVFDVVQGKTFDQRDQEEKRRFFMALATLGSMNLLDFFLDQLDQGLLDRSQHKTECQVASVFALNIIGGDKAKKAIEKAKGKTMNPKPLRDVCSQVLLGWDASHKK